MKSIGKYLRELSIVVTGIAITIGIGLWVSSKNSEKDLKLNLNAIKLELEENIMYLIDREAELLPEWKYAEYLKSHKKDQLDFDIIKGFAKNGYTNVDFIFFKTGAFEMFKSSGAMRLLKNKELMQKIWDTYFWLHRQEVAFEKLTQIKIDELLKWVEEKKNYPDKQIIPLYDFYVIGFYDFYYEGIKSTYNQLFEMLNGTLLEFEKEFNKKDENESRYSTNNQHLMARRYTSFSWRYLFINDYDQSEQFALKAWELDSTYSVSKTNLAHAMLFQDRFSEAEAVYKELSQTIYKNNEPYTKVLLNDFDELEKAGAIPEKHKDDVEKIRKILRE